MEELIEDLKRLIDSYGETSYEVAVKLNEIYKEAYQNDDMDEFWALVEDAGLNIDANSFVRPIIHFEDGRTLRVSAWMNSFLQVWNGDTTDEGFGLWEVQPADAAECASCRASFTNMHHQAVAFSDQTNYNVVRVCTPCHEHHTSWETCPLNSGTVSFFSRIPSHLCRSVTTDGIHIRTLESMPYSRASRAAASWIATPDMYGADEIQVRQVASMLEGYENSPVPTRVLNYSASPLSEYGNSFVLADGEAKPKTGRYYGVELEVETLPQHSLQDSAAAIAQRIHPFGILTTDASLRDGFEIKSLPATLKAHKQIWTRFFAKKPGQFVSSWKSGRCGMHVHVSAASISPMTLGKLNMFMNNLMHSQFISMIAGRDIRQSMYCSPNLQATSIISAFSAPRVARQYRVQYRKYYDGKMRAVEHGHHTAFVGAESGKPTYEFRIFRGNLSSAGFFKNLEFVDALITWCEETPPRHINPASFTDWLILPSHASQYRHLLAYLKEKGTYQEVRGLTVYHDEEKELRVT